MMQKHLFFRAPGQYNALHTMHIMLNDAILFETVTHFYNPTQKNTHSPAYKIEMFLKKYHLISFVSISRNGLLKSCARFLLR